MFKPSLSFGQRVGLVIVFCWFFFGGIGHFLYSPFFTSIVPPYIPAPKAMVAISGVFEIAGALGLLLSATRRAAGLGLFVLTLCVTPANIWMWQHPELFPGFDPRLLSLRLVLQVLLLACILWSTRRPRNNSAFSALR